MREASVSAPVPQRESEVTALKLRSRSPYTVRVRERRTRLCPTQHLLSSAPLCRTLPSSEDTGQAQRRQCEREHLSPGKLL